MIKQLGDYIIEQRNQNEKAENNCQDPSSA